MNEMWKREPLPDYDSDTTAGGPIVALLGGAIVLVVAFLVLSTFGLLMLKLVAFAWS